MFDGDLPAKCNKPELVRELEENLQASDYNFTTDSSYQTAEFMSEVKKIPEKRAKLNLTVMNDLFEIAYTSVTSASQVNQIHIVYDSYEEESLKECERIRRQKECDPLEFVNLKKILHFQCRWIVWGLS